MAPQLGVKEIARLKSAARRGLRRKQQNGEGSSSSEEPRGEQQSSIAAIVEDTASEATSDGIPAGQTVGKQPCSPLFRVVSSYMHDTQCRLICYMYSLVTLYPYA